MNTSNVIPITAPDITISLANSTLLVKLTSTTWTANIRDRKASEEVIASHGVSGKKAARVHKSLLPDSKLHADIESLIGEARRAIQAKTLPWSDGGERILNVKLLPEFMTMMEKYETDFNMLVSDLLADLPNEIAKASFTMGTLYDRDDYPSDAEIAHKYSFKFDITPLPTTGDFRVDMPTEMGEQVKGAYQRASQARIDTAMKDAWSRMHVKLTHLIDRLTDGDEGERKRFSNGLIESALELVDTPQFLNVSGDLKLEQARLAMKEAIGTLSTAQVKESGLKRMEIVENVKDVMGKFDMLNLS
jgi:hypothetical protein